MTRLARALPRRYPGPASDLAHAVEHARILRAAGDAAGAARVLDDAFAAEGVRAPAASERLRFRALLQRADLALALHDAGTWGAPPADDDALRQLADSLTALEDGAAD